MFKLGYHTRSYPLRATPSHDKMSSKAITAGYFCPSSRLRQEEEEEEDGPREEEEAGYTQPLIYRSHINLVFLSACHRVSHVNFYTLCCQHAERQ